jgi:hypothetical protein
LSWNTLPAAAARSGGAGAVRSPGNAVTSASGAVPPDGGESTIGGAFGQLPDDEARHAERERLEIVLPFLPEPLAVERELVHRAEDAPIVRRRDPYLAHGLALRSQEPLVDIQPVE